MQQQQTRDEQHQRKKLTKKSTPSPSDHQQQNSPRRTPSAPSRNRSKSNPQQPALHYRSPTLPNPSTSSQTSIEARNYTGAYRHNSYDANAAQQNAQPRYIVSDKASTDLLGQRFDSAAILSNLYAVPYSSEIAPPSQPQATPAFVQQHYEYTATRPTEPQYSDSSDSRVALASPGVDLFQSFVATGRRMEDISQPRGDLGVRNPRQRLSDEAKAEGKLRKKSGLSSLFGNLVGSPRKPTISAPENPVHVTHVGYDQETGEFTVGRIEHVRRCFGTAPAHLVQLYI